MRNLILVFVGSTALICMTVPGLSQDNSNNGTGYMGPIGPKSATFNDYAVALRLLKHEQYAEAIPHLESALAGRRHSADILNYLGFTHRMIGDYQASLDYTKRALIEDPDHKGAHENLGELYLQMHDLASAQKELATLASLCPSGCDERDTLTRAISAYVPAPPTTGQSP
jgi:tetratricopeptide (TPR) repeat protein